MTTRSQKRKVVCELASGEFETSVAENSQPENLVAGPSKSPKLQAEKLDEMNKSLMKEIMSDSTKILDENQKEMLKLIAAPAFEKPMIHQNVEDFDSEMENDHPASTSTPIKSKATTSKTTPINRRNNGNMYNRH